MYLVSKMNAPVCLCGRVMTGQRKSVQSYCVIMCAIAKVFVFQCMEKLQLIRGQYSKQC